MYGWKKAAAALGIWAVLTAVFPAVSIAAVKTETRTPITSVSLKVRSDVQADYELNEATVYATTDSSLYTIGAYKWAAKNNKDYWEPGDEPKVQIEIHARSGYYFNRTTGPSKFQIDGATYKSVKRTNNDETLLLTVLLTPASGTLEIPDTAEWMGYPPGKATWAQVPYAGAYELKLYRNGQMVQARKLWQCNEKIALLNYGRFKEMDLERRLTPALLSYEGIQYQYMAPGVFEQGQWDYVQEHLRILSGFYGILKPLDGIVPYRLEMQAKVELPSGIKSLYDYWGSSICRELAADETLIVNLASKEYSRAVEPYLEAHIDYVTCVFGTLAEDGTGGLKVKVKATEAKMARGEMVRFMAERGVRDAEGLKGFDRLGYRYCQEKSGDKEYVFTKIREQ